MPFFLVWIKSLSLIIILDLGIGLGLLSLYKTPEPSIRIRLPVIIWAFKFGKKIIKIRLNKYILT